MAEQASHNVVNVPQSASASSPLVDAAANHTSSTFAESGNDSSSVPSTQITDASTSQNTLGATAPETKAVNAGEAAAEPSAGDAAAKSHDIPAISQPVGADGDSKAGLGVPTTNGVHDNGSQGSAVEEGGSQDASAANSDTDTSKGEALEAKDGHLHVRTNSVKKPTTFSKISATKNFLAKSASTAPAVAKTGERASPVSAASSAVAPPAAKPRLIAKTGASLRELQKARQNAESPSGPDASKVWNKNRPAAPPPPKQFTDEELKQQYGIHLATRLQSDENGKESKWADIDEDEDDWVPEAVTWIDGTKSALTPADNTPVPKEAKPAQPDGGKPAESVKPSLTALKKPTEPSGPPKTILKPGAAAAQAKQNGLPSSSPGTEKATLKAKSPAPPSKSPWATLPPVDKFSPVNPPVQQIAPPVQLATQDARAYEPHPQPQQQQPTREIAADTFDRSWREGEGGSRELFNSVTGQYEMAPEGRRSSRPEPFGRKPSVLQRPSQQGTNHPPEPSPAFQTRSGSQTDGPPSWARRRGSSVSQSGMPPRRMSINRGPEPFTAHERRTGTVVGHDMRTSPHDPKAEPPHGMFSQQNAWQQQMPAPPQAGSGEELEDPVKVQERIMKEKRELARKRRQEEEQEAEAARKERLKAKMAALSGAGQSRQEREAAKEAAAAAPKPVVEPTLDAIKSPPGREDQAAPPKEPEAAAAASELPSQARVPPPTSGTSDPTGTKLPSPDKIELPSSISKPDSAGLPSRSISDHLHRQVARGPLSPKANSRAPFQQAASPYHAPNSAFSSPGDRKPQPFGRSPMAGNDGFSPWPSAGSGNVWGTGSIGNGVFESSSSFAPAPMFSQQNSALPPPPGMTRPGTSARISPQGLGAESKSPSLQQNHMPEQGRAFAPPGMEGRPDQFMGQAMPNGSASSPGLGRPQRVPGPIAPPSRAQPSMQSQLSEDSKINAWRNAAQTLPAQYANASQAAALNSQEGTVPSQSNNTFRETFRQTTRGRLGGPRKTEKPEFTIHDAQGSRAVSSLNPAPPSTQTQPSVPVPTSSPLSHPWKQTGENTVRLPNSSMSNSHNGAPVQQPPIGPPQMRPQPAPVGTPRKAKMPSDPLPPTVDSREQPPPPPESTNHPVFGGNAKQPHVRLPLVKPIVRLPPQSAVPIAQQPAVMMPPRQHWGPPAAMRPIVQNEAWQARFNGLFARTNITTETPPSPPKTPPKTQAPAIGVSASSRDALHEIPSTSAATVSLPHAQQTLKLKSPEGFIIDDSADVTSKDTIEQMFNEELSFGSKPLTRIPRNPQYMEAGADAKYNMFNLKPQDLPKPVDPQSKPQFNIHQVQFRNSKGCFVKMPGVKTKHNPIFWKRTGQAKGVSKPKAKALAAKENAASPAPGAAPAAANAGSRKASSQKGSTVSTPQQNSPGPTPSAAQAPANGKRGPSFKGPKGRGQNVPVKST